jgi:tyrosine phenol-lyase
MTAQQWPYEPYKIKVVEPLAVTTRARREEALRDAGWNLFGLRAEDVTHHQWAAMLSGDETYAGARSWSRFEQTVREIFGFRHVIPTHQGRAAERILFTALVNDKNQVVPSNAHFDTTKGNLEMLGVRPKDFPTYEARDPGARAPFKGDADLAAVEKQIRDGGVPFVMLTVTNNAGGGQPVSMANLRGMGELAHAYGIPFVIDACRFAENAYFIQQREPGYATASISEIVHEMFAQADAITMSAKKDGLANIGGFICVNDDEVAARVKQLCIAGEGYPTYGGLAGRDLDAIAVGLREVLDEDWAATPRIWTRGSSSRTCRGSGTRRKPWSTRSTWRAAYAVPSWAPSPSDSTPPRAWRVPRCGSWSGWRCRGGSTRAATWSTSSTRWPPSTTAGTPSGA